MEIPTANLTCPTCGSETTQLISRMDDRTCCPSCNPTAFGLQPPYEEFCKAHGFGEFQRPIIREEIRSAISELLEPLLFRGGVIKKLRLEPGEILCLFVPGKLSEANQVQIQKSINDLFPGRKCVILDEGVDLRVLHPEDDEPESDVVDA